MEAQTYAIVVYLKGPLAEFVNHLRRELNPQYAGKGAHVSVLPPRPLIISEAAAVDEARAQCAEWEPFEVEVSSVKDFLPVNGVVYLELGRGAQQMCRLNQTLNQGHLAHQEPLLFTPHITIAQDLDEQRTRQLLVQVTQEVAAYTGPRRLLVETLTFVRQAPNGDWLDLADLQLGRARVPVQ